MAVDWHRPTPRHFHWFDDDDDQCRDAATDAVAAVVDDITIRRATAATGATCMADAIILHAATDVFTDVDQQLVADVINDVIENRFPHITANQNDVNYVAWIANVAVVALHAAGLPVGRDQLTILVGDAVHHHQKGARS